MACEGGGRLRAAFLEVSCRFIRLVRGLLLFVCSVGMESARRGDVVRMILLGMRGFGGATGGLSFRYFAGSAHRPRRDIFAWFIIHIPPPFHTTHTTHDIQTYIKKKLHTRSPQPKLPSLPPLPSLTHTQTHLRLPPPSRIPTSILTPSTKQTQTCPLRTRRARHFRRFARIRIPVYGKS